MDKRTFFVVLIGVVALFGDFTYEGARSIIPQFFTTVLGGSVFLLGLVLGVGEFLGYALRLVSGKLVDTTHKYWSMFFIGYFVNLFALPLLAFTGSYALAAFLIIIERIGRATRIPPRDYMISTVATNEKMGRAFAIEELLDQIGAVVGPLSVSLILLYNQGYRTAFETLFIPAILSFITIIIAYRFYKKVPIPRKKVQPEKLMSTRRFLLYSVAIAVSAAGLYNVAFVLYGAQAQISTYAIPLIFLVAMASEGIFGFVFGILYDRVGRNLVYLGIVATAAIPLALLNGSAPYLFVAALFFGAATGIQDTVMRAVVGSMIQKEKRGFAYGIFNSFFGFGLMLSSIVVGYLYSSSLIIVEYVVAVQLVALLLLYVSFREDAHVT